MSINGAVTIAIGVALGILLAGGIAFCAWWSVSKGYAHAGADRIVAGFGIVRRNWLQGVFGGVLILGLALTGSPIFQDDAFEARKDQFTAVWPDPTLCQSLRASFNNNFVGSILLMGADTISAMGNITSVADAEIENRIQREHLSHKIGEFIYVRTQGELDAKVVQIERQEFNKHVSKDGGLQGFATDLFASAFIFATAFGIPWLVKKIW